MQSFFRVATIGAAAVVLAAGTATLEQIGTHVDRLADPEYHGLGWAWVGPVAQSASRATGSPQARQ